MLAGAVTAMAILSSVFFSSYPDGEVEFLILPGICN